MSLRNFVSIVLAIALLLVNAVALVSAAASEDDDDGEDLMRFGMDARSMDLQAQAGVAPDYGTFWLGPWTLESGWGGPGKTMTAMREAGVTPAIHFYYWGDDISPACVEEGCWSDLHGTHKNRENWQKLAQELVDNLHAHMGGEPVLVFMETEFNKNGIPDHDPFDGYLANITAFIRDGYPAAETVMALGNWNRGSWSNFNATADASDYIGIQGMRGSTRDSLSSYRSIYEDTVHGVERMQDLFGKPIMVLDIALSSYPEPDYLRYQAETLEDFFIGMERLQQAGVEGIIYRAWHDHPSKDEKNYYGTAERHWGLKWNSSSDLKPSGEVWIAGVQAARNDETYQSPLSSERAFEATFDLSDNIGQWWVETYAAGSNPLERVQARVDEGKWHTLEYTDWGTWAKSFHAPEGSAMELRVTDVKGNTVSTFPFAWMQEAPRIDDSATRPASAVFTGQADELHVAFDASASSDPYDRDLRFHWDFGDGQTGSGPLVDHTYNKSGGYYVTLVVDNGDLTNSTTKTLHVEAPPPTAAFTNVTDGGLRVHLDASGSGDPLGRDLTHMWDFGDGSRADGEQVTHIYNQSGDYTVSLTVDNGETTNTTHARFHLHSPPPSAAFTTTTKGLSAAFDASNSSDEYDRGLEHAWALGDGTQKTGRKIEHTYSESGTYQVILTVDNGEHTANHSRNLSVVAPPPEAEFTYITDHLNVTLDGSSSHDPLGRNLTYTWDLGDGTNTTGKQFAHAYNQSGTYEVTLIVDNGEHTANHTRNLSVVAPPPEADFTYTTENLTIGLNATSSTDPLGRNLTYTWNLSDGAHKTGRYLEHTYSQSGTYQVILTVDNGEHTANHSRNLSVVAPPPEAEFTYITDHLNVTLDGSSSHDPLRRNLTYSWDLGDGTNTTGKQVAHAYNQSGTYEVTLTVDNGEHTANHTRNLSVVAPPPEAHFTPAIDNLTVTLDGSSSHDPTGRNLTYSWDLGDGTNTTGIQVNHTYADSGTYLVTLSVGNGEFIVNHTQNLSVERPPDDLKAKFSPASGSNEWWVEVYVDANHALAKVEAQVDGGSWRTLEEKDWGSWAASIKAPEGSEVIFRAADEHGQRIKSPTYVWLHGQKEETDEPADPEHSPLTAKFSPASGSNEWWVEVYVDANHPLAKVEAQVDGGSWHTLQEKDWGSWAASFHAPVGSEVIFRATDEHGQQVKSATYLWLQGEKPEDPEHSPLTAKFSPASGSNEWWVEVYVDANHPLAKVEAQVDGGSWHTLQEKDWGSWAASFHAPEGSEVIFRATDEHGQQTQSGSYTW